MALPSLPPFAALRAFDLVGRTGGIRKAAEALGVSHAIVSRHMAALEDLLGVMLLNRRDGSLTEVGRDYHARIAGAIAAMEEATQAVRARSGGHLTVWCSPGFALHWLTRRLPDFTRRRDQPVIDLRSTDSEPQFERNEADGDIRYQLDGVAPPVDRGVRIEELARPPVFPLASPELMKRRARPLASLADLAAMPLIQEGSDWEWRAWMRAQGGSEDLPPPVARYGQAHLTLAAARAGQGVALSNHFLAAEDLALGRLVPVAPLDQPLIPVALGAYIFRCARTRWSDPTLTRFRNWLRAQLLASAIGTAG